MQEAFKVQLDNQLNPAPKTNDMAGAVLTGTRASVLREFDSETQALGLAQESLPNELKHFDTLVKHGKTQLAMPLVIEVLRKDSWNVAALTRLAQLFNAKGDLDSEIRTRENLVKVSHSFQNLSALAQAYYLKGNDEKALEKYFESLRWIQYDEPGLFDVYKNIGNILVRQGDYDGAEENYNKAYTINPDSDILLVNLGTLSIQRNEFNQALERFRRALSVGPRNDKAWVGLALAHQQMGDIDLAHANVLNAIEINPRNRTAVHLVCNWMSRQEYWIQVIEVLQNYLALVDFDEEMSLALIHALCVTNQFSLARLEVERVLLFNPRQTDVLKLRNRLDQEFSL